MKYKKCVILFLVATTTALSACKKPKAARGLIRNADLSTFQIAGDTHVKFSADLKAGKLRLQPSEIPVVDPNTGVKLGFVKIAPPTDLGNHIEVAMNTTQAAKLPDMLPPLFPNGLPLPRKLRLTAKKSIVTVPLLMASRIYIGNDQAPINQPSTAFAGMAITLPIVDVYTSQVPFPLKLFFGYPMKNEFRGVAGAYSSPMPMQSGIAFFIKKSAITGEISIDDGGLASWSDENVGHGSSAARQLNSFMNTDTLVEIK